MDNKFYSGIGSLPNNMNDGKKVFALYLKIIAENLDSFYALNNNDNNFVCNEHFTKTLNDIQQYILNIIKVTTIDKSSFLHKSCNADIHENSQTGDFKITFLNFFFN